MIRAALAVALVVTATAAGAAPLDARHSPYLPGNASPAFGAGVAGLPILALSRGVIVVRNNTGHDLEHLRVRVRAMSRGRMISASLSSLARPYHVAAGEIALATIDTSCGIPSGQKNARCRLVYPRGTVFRPGRSDYTPVDHDTGHDLLVQGLTSSGGALTGSGVASQYATRNATGYSAVAFCFSAAGKPLRSYGPTGPLEGVALKPGDARPFTIPVGDCPVYLVSFSGLDPEEAP